MIQSRAGYRAQNALRRLLAGPALRKAPSQQQQRLHNLVEHALAQVVKALCEIVIGVVELRRQAATYEPKKDPSIRVSGGRLRQRLAEHHRQAHPMSGVRIEIPGGAYLPRFVPAPRGQAMASGVLVPLVEGTGMTPGMADLCHEFLGEELHTVPALEVDSSGVEYARLWCGRTAMECLRQDSTRMMATRRPPDRPPPAPAGPATETPGCKLASYIATACRRYAQISGQTSSARP